MKSLFERSTATIECCPVVAVAVYGVVVQSHSEYIVTNSLRVDILCDKNALNINTSGIMFHICYIYHAIANIDAIA